jgi:hypothetical protein
MRTIVRIKSDYIRYNLVCHLEKTNECQKKLEKGSEQVVIIARTRYL